MHHEPVNDWQVQEIVKALVEADRGRFATPREVLQTFRKWTDRTQQRDR